MQRVSSKNIFVDYVHKMWFLWDSSIPILYIGYVVAKTYLCDIRLVGAACTIYLFDLPLSLACAKEPLNQKNKLKAAVNNTAQTRS